MRTFCIIVGSIAAVLGFLLSFFLDSFAYIPVVFGIILGIGALLISKRDGMRESVPKLIIALSFLAAAITTMNLFRENQVAEDVEQISEEEKQQEEENLKELENLEGLE
jgi:ABC-type Mn2+/Zn2+ transport system permease subunit